jgi:hypothetical protein
MDARLDPHEYAFAALEPDAAVPQEAFCSVREDEGVSVILRRDAAERLGLTPHFPCRRITLHVRSSLSAVGFLARVCTALAAAGIAANAVSAFHHDHLFVPAVRAHDALDVLRAAARS